MQTGSRKSVALFYYPTDCSAATQLPQSCKHSESANLLHSAQIATSSCLGGSKAQTAVFVQAQTAADLLTLVSHYCISFIFLSIPFRSVYTSINHSKHHAAIVLINFPDTLLSSLFAQILQYDIMLCSLGAQA